jgi:uncharacterized protein (DUF362 family)
MSTFFEKEITRRQFIKGTVAAYALTTVPLSGAFLNPKPSVPSGASELVIARQGTPAQLLRAAMSGIGGMGRFVKKGQRVVIKANIAWARTPDQACTNNPELLNELIKMCYEAGAKRVAVWDHTCDNYQFAFTRSGLKSVTQKAGADIFSGHGRNVYRSVDIPRGRKLKKVEVLKDVLDSDVFINFPLPKQHFATELTLSLKNLMGIIWDMEELHRIDLHQCIADINTIRKPNLVVVDAIRILTSNGPKGPGKTVDPNQVIVSQDSVAADAYAATLFKHPKTGKPFKAEQIMFIRNAHELGLGEIDLSRVRVKKVTAS